MLPQVDVRHLYSVVILAEELNFTCAAHRLRITQSALSRQITELETQHGFQLFNRDRKRAAQLTEAGRTFVQEARSALLHADRAIHFARAAHHGYENVLLVGHTHHADQEWVSTLLTIRLPLFPKLKVRLTTLFAMELVRSVLANELHMALVTAPVSDAKLTVVSFAETQLCAVMPETHPAANNDQLQLRHLAKDEWIVFPRSVNPLIHGSILEQPEGKEFLPRRPMRFSPRSRRFIWYPKAQAWQSCLGQARWGFAPKVSQFARYPICLYHSKLAWLCGAMTIPSSLTTSPEHFFAS